jgi:hypothetical protein
MVDTWRYPLVPEQSLTLYLHDQDAVLAEMGGRREKLFSPLLAPTVA